MKMLNFQLYEYFKEPSIKCKLANCLAQHVRATSLSQHQWLNWWFGTD